MLVTEVAMVKIRVLSVHQVPYHDLIDHRKVQLGRPPLPVAHGRYQLTTLRSTDRLKTWPRVKAP